MASTRTGILFALMLCAIQAADSRCPGFKLPADCTCSIDEKGQTDGEEHTDGEERTVTCPWQKDALSDPGSFQGETLSTNQA